MKKRVAIGFITLLFLLTTAWAQAQTQTLDASQITNVTVPGGPAAAAASSGSNNLGNYPTPISYGFASPYQQFTPARDARKVADLNMFINDWVENPIVMGWYAKNLSKCSTGGVKVTMAAIHPDYQAPFDNNAFVLLVPGELDIRELLKKIKASNKEPRYVSPVLAESTSSDVWTYQIKGPMVEEAIRARINVLSLFARVEGETIEGDTKSGTFSIGALIPKAIGWVFGLGVSETKGKASTKVLEAFQGIGYEIQGLTREQWSLLRGEVSNYLSNLLHTQNDAVSKRLRVAALKLDFEAEQVDLELSMLRIKKLEIKKQSLGETNDFETRKVDQQIKALKLRGTIVSEKAPSYIVVPGGTKTTGKPADPKEAIGGGAVK